MSNKKKFLSSPKLKHGGLSVLIVAAVIVVVAVLNIAVSALDKGFGLSYDLSNNKLYTLSAQTQKAISALDKDVHIYGLMQTGSESTTVENLLENYRKLSPDHIEVTVVDPVANPTFAKQFTSETLNTNSVIVTNGDGSRYRVIDQYDMYEMSYTYTSSGYSYYPKSFIGEQKLTNAIGFVTADEVANCYFLTGHQEASAENMAHITDYIEGENLIVGDISVTNITDLKVGDILIVCMPQQDLSEDERLVIKDYLENGGYMIYMVDATCPELPVFESLLDLYGIGIDHTLVVEGDENAYYSSPVYLVPDITEHDITAGLTANDQVAVIPYATSITMPAITDDDVEVSTLLTTTKKSYIKTNLDSTVAAKEDGDKDGPATVAMALRRVDADGNDAGEKIVVFSGAGFVGSSSFYALSGNTDLMLGAIRWMNGETDTVTIVGKNLMTNSLRFNSTGEMYVMAAIAIIVMPVIILAVGLVVWLKRRHL